MAARRYPPDVYSGTETVFANLYQRARKEHDVRLVVGWTRSRDLVPPEAVAVRLKDKNKGRAWASMSRAIFKEVRSWKPDVVLSNSIEVPPTGVPTACIVHDLNFGRSNGGMSERLKAQFYAVRARALQSVITVSGASSRALVAAGVPEERIRVVHNGVDVDAFSPMEVNRADGRVHFAYPSRILPGKGQHLAIDAIARLSRPLKKKAHLTIVGAVADPVYLDQLRVQAHNQPVTFATDVPEIVPYYQRADVIVYPTVMEEGFGFTGVEGMACGKPVIWFDQPAVREATGGIGVPVDRGDVVGLRDAMAQLISNEERRRELGVVGRAYAVEHLSWAGVWSRYAEVLQSIAR